MILTTGLYGFGSNSNGQLGIGNISDYEKIPVLCDISNVKHISCQFGTTFILTNDGSVYTCGIDHNLVNIIGYKLLTPVKLPLNNITNIVSAHEHTIFVENELYHGHGSNYHNQLNSGYKGPIGKNLFFK